ncbi:hypothetical protein NE237_001913 [Protea cynaroides]|uniref:DCD domain-containing protein n=1 Tax=Protea cynaroides TaxID=273540 RepID=A0A9Q0KTZ9_9MAGN|nr:hypothetical protein NE237_001913 [Protea cynaroides]
MAPKEDESGFQFSNMSSSSSSLLSRPSGGVQRRPSAAQTPVTNRVPSAVIHPDIEPAPKPRLLTQYLALGVIIFLVFLQFMPATHIRDPYGPSGTWLPADSNLRYSASSSSSNVSGTSTAGEKDDIIHIVSWMDCLDLQVLAVLANSTLSNSRYPDKLYFHFFIPLDHKEKLHYYKLKVLFPYSKLEVLGQEEVKDILATVTSQDEYRGPSLDEMAPFIIPIAHPSISRFIYVSPDIIVKGRIEELHGVDLSMYGAAAAEDCTKSLSTYVKFDVLDAIQRSASNPWVSREPYKRSACVPDLDVILVDSRTLKINMVEAILWWSRILNIESERKTQTHPALVLTLYNRYVKLPATWGLEESRLSPEHEGGVLRYDGPRKASLLFSSEKLNCRPNNFLFCCVLSYRMGRGKKTQKFFVSEVPIPGPPKANRSVSARNLRKKDFSGVIFGCKNYTIKECLSQKLFGLPELHFSYVKNIKPGMPLFLFNYSDRRLHGIFEAASCGMKNINPHGWTANGSEETEYPAQVRINIRMQCQTLTENQFKPKILENYYTDKHFWFELDCAQTSELISLFEASSTSAHSAIPKKVCTGESSSTIRQQVCTVEKFLETSSRSAHPIIQKKVSTWCDIVKTHPIPDKRKENDATEKTCNPDKPKGYDDPCMGDLNQPKMEAHLDREAEDNQFKPIISDNYYRDDHFWNEQDRAPTSELVSLIEASSASVHSAEGNEISVFPSDFQSVIAQLMQEVQNLKNSSLEQLNKMSALEKNLSDSQVQIQQLKARIKMLESIFGPTVRYLNESDWLLDK